MFISLEKKILFFHISKAAGSSVTTFLHSQCSDGENSFKTIFTDNIHRAKSLPIYKKWRHALINNNFTHMPQYDAKLFLELSNIDTSDFFEFIIVRNPYDRFISQLLYQPFESFKWSKNFIRGDYVAFIDEYLDRHGELRNNSPDNYFNLFQTQYSKYPITNNLHIYRYEELDKLSTDLYELIGNGTIPHINQSKNKHKHAFNLNYEQKRKVYQLFRKDFETFGYDRDYSTINSRTV